MLISILLLVAVVAGGFSLTYFLDDDARFLWRISAGIVIGSVVLGVVVFVLAVFFGLSAPIAAIAILITFAPVAFVWKNPLVARDWNRAKGKLQGANFRKFLSFSYYAILLLLLAFFFERAMITTDQGIFTGGSNNLGDLPFHLGAIFSFTEGQNFPPQNPSFAGAKFSYPFIADLLTATFVKIGADVASAMAVQNIAWAFSLAVILERFVAKLTDDRLAGKLAPVLLFLSGGFGFIWFLGDFASQSKSFFDFLWQLPRDYTIGQDFRWGNSLITLFLTQRSILLGMPITLVVLGWLWEILRSSADSAANLSYKRSFAYGLLAGTLPLVHLHSLFVIFIVSAFFFFFKLSRVKEWLSFGFGVACVAVPMLVWSMSGTANEASKFFELQFGWDSGESNFILFWIKNTGLLFVMLCLGLLFVVRHFRSAGDDALQSGYLLVFFIPFAFVFILGNSAKLAPWVWDNIKVLIYAFVGSLPFITIALSRMWQSSRALKVLAATCFAALILAGSLDVWRTISAQIKYGVFDQDAVRIAERIKRQTPASALFLNAPTYNSAVVLTGRQSLMRYSGHLASHGIDYGQRETDVRSIYLGAANADELLRKYSVDFIVVSPEERNALKANEQYFSKFPVVAESGQYKVYKVR